MSLSYLKSIPNLISKYINVRKNRLVSVYSEFLNKNREINDASKQQEHIVSKKVNELNDWYVKITGLDEIKRIQDRVILIQMKLEVAQDERRQVGKRLMEIRRKSNELQEQLQQVKRWEDAQRYLDLTRQETEVFKEEKQLQEQFDLLDKSEREIFTALSNAVRDSHEKEKSRTEYTKYLGIILTIVSSIVGAIISTCISTIRNHQIVNGINKGVEEKFIQLQQNASTTDPQLKKQLEKHEQLLLKRRPAEQDNHLQLESIMNHQTEQICQLLDEAHRKLFIITGVCGIIFFILLRTS